MMPDTPPPAEQQALPAGFNEQLHFDGRASEYFRIWVVNLLFTLLTLGLYAPWAKVRKARWFAQHTVLAGDRFDFHGDPRRILMGRLVALALLLLWSYAFEFSLWLGLAVLALFCVAGPLLFASAQRFKLANTSWRGLRFGFDVPRAEVYRVCVPLLLLWTASSVVQAAEFASNTPLLVVAGLTVLGLPWAHARLKLLQHNHARFGTQRFSFLPRTSGFYGLYAKAFGLLLLGGALAGGVGALLASVMHTWAHKAGVKPELLNVALLTSAVAALCMWVMAWPYFAARSQQLVWGQTRFSAVRFEGHMTGRRLWRLVLGNSALVLLTAGLYWPFAAVAVARYRVQAIQVLSDQPMPDVQAPTAATAAETRATGDGAADFFGLDIGW
jgi:uncharacterized membrane protein YjgN (DUF898 family)